MTASRILRAGLAAGLLAAPSMIVAQDGAAATEAAPAAEPAAAEPTAEAGARPTTNSLPPETRQAALEVYGWVMGMRTQLLYGFDDAEIDAILAGLRNARSAESPEPASLEGLMPIAYAIYRERQQEMEAAAEAAGAAVAAGESGKNAEYFAGLAANPAIKKTESGLYYEILAEGAGRTPTENDTVKLHYHGTLIDGTVFDSSKERGEPAEFPVRGVIPGFGEGVRLLREGGKARLHIAPELGYGNRQAGRIPPGSVLVFEIELLEVIAP